MTNRPIFGEIDRITLSHLLKCRSSLSHPRQRNETIHDFVVDQLLGVVNVKSNRAQRHFMSSSFVARKLVEQRTRGGRREQLSPF
jgi:hypothetical protein